MHSNFDSIESFNTCLFFHDKKFKNKLKDEIIVYF